MHSTSPPAGDATPEAPPRSAQGVLLLHGGISHALLTEATVQLNDRHAILSRFERVQKDELFDILDPRHQRAYTVDRLSLGYAFDIVHVGIWKLGIGAPAAWTRFPEDLRSTYGQAPRSGQVFVDLRTH